LLFAIHIVWTKFEVTSSIWSNFSKLFFDYSLLRHKNDLQLSKSSFPSNLGTLKIFLKKSKKFKKFKKFQIFLSDLILHLSAQNIIHKACTHRISWKNGWILVFFCVYSSHSRVTLATSYACVYKSSFLFLHSKK
jgi:hypothetical protein